MPGGQFLRGGVVAPGSATTVTSISVSARNGQAECSSILSVMLAAVRGAD